MGQPDAEAGRQDRGSLTDAAAAARRALTAAGAGPVSCTGRRWAGRQGECALLARPAGDVVVKWFDGARQPDPWARAVHEYELLRVLGGVVDALSVERAGTGGWRAQVPRPVMVLPDAAAFVMGHLPGRSLDEILATDGLPARDQRAVAALVARVVTDFHRAAGEPYGDLHAGNLVLDGRDVGFLDVGSSRSLVTTAVPAGPRPHLAVDLAVWLGSVGFTSPGRYRGELRLLARRLGLAHRMVSAMVAGPTDVDSRAVLAAARRLLRADVRRRELRGRAWAAAWSVVLVAEAASLPTRWRLRSRCRVIQDGRGAECPATPLPTGRHLPAAEEDP